MRALNVNVYGGDERFWRIQDAADQKAPPDRTVFVGAALALHYRGITDAKSISDVGSEHSEKLVENRAGPAYFALTGLSRLLEQPATA